MPETRPGITFNEEGVCLPCQMFEQKKNVNWKERWYELGELCEKYRRKHRIGGLKYDCVIALSGGKDSHFQVGLFKNILGMNPLGIMIDNTSWTETGRKNFDNLSEQFGIDIITFTPNRKEMKKRVKEDFIKYCHPMKYWDEILYRKPLEIAQNLGIDLVIWGENTSLVFGGSMDKESPDAKRLIARPEDFPDLEVIFTSYYVYWSRFFNADYAKSNGFITLEEEWKRWGMDGFEYEQIDTVGYLVNQYCKFIKFGFKCITELCSDAIRHGIMTREEAIKRVNEDDFKLDYEMEKDFREFIGITAKNFWFYIDKHVNRDLLEKKSYFYQGWEYKEDFWRLKEDAV